MNCSSCQQENRSGLKFCSHCGAGLQITCPSCQSPNEVDDKFCGQCATPLVVEPQPPQPQEVSRLPGLIRGPSSFANGRYEVVRFLGEGGTKRVYLVHDEMLNREVALAVIRSEGLDDVSRHRIMREAQTMGKLGEHPNIMPIYDIGEDAGQIFMVLPLMAGGSVEDSLRGAPDGRLPIDETIEIGLAVADGLAYAHSHGVIHRDLKPGNIWFTRDGQPRIGDFGLALSLDRSRITSQDVILGTPWYMSPEQAMGGEMTVRSDLYSLGAMIYEMVTGRPPFTGDNPVAIIGQHINTAAVAPTWHNPECPKPLEALILRMLSKDPAQRPESADEVKAALEAMIAGAMAVSSPEDPLEESISIEGVDNNPFVGRRQQLDELKSSVEEIMSGRGRMVMLVGEPGIGKTRMAQELTSYAHLRGVQTIWGSCFEEQGMPPYWPLVQAIRSYVQEHEPEQLASEMGDGAAEIAKIVPELSERLPSIQKPPQLENPQQARFRLFDSITKFLQNASQSKPLILFLDDLHWADEPTLLFLEFLAKQLDNHRLMVVGAFRNIELTRRHPLTQTLGELTRSPNFKRVNLTGLNVDEVRQIVSNTADVDPPEKLVVAVHDRTEGNPLFVTEVARLLVQEGQLTDDVLSNDHTLELRVPEGIREVIGRRLGRLSERCDQVLTVASVIGREFSLQQIEALGDRATDDPLKGIEEALESNVVEEIPDAVGQYRFPHVLIQETLAMEISAVRRARLHAEIGAAFENLYASDLEGHAAELAYHYGRAAPMSDPNKAIHFSILAGERSLAIYAYEEALGHFQRALAAKQAHLSIDESFDTGNAPVEDGQTADILYGLGRSQRATSTVSMQEAWVTLSLAFKYFVKVNDVPKIVAVAEYLPVTEHRETTELIAQALELVPAESHEAGRLLSRYGTALNFEKGEYEGARDAFSRAVSIARREHDVSLEMRAVTYASLLDGEHLRLRESLDNSLRAVELARTANDPQAEFVARFWAATNYYVTGQLNEAIGHAEASLDLAEGLHNRNYLTTALWVNETLAELQGDWTTARRLSDRGLQLAPDDSRFLSTRAVMEYQTGHLDEGAAFVERLIGVMQQEDADPDLEYALPALVIPIVARIDGDDRSFEIAERAAKAVLTSPSTTPSLAMLTRVGRLLMAISQGNNVVTSEEYRAVVSSQGTMLMGGLGSIDRLLGLACACVGEAEEATSHFEAALAHCRQAGYDPELGWVCWDYAQHILNGAAQPDLSRIIQMLDEALKIAVRLEMIPLRDRVMQRRKELAIDSEAVTV